MSNGSRLCLTIVPDRLPSSSSHTIGCLASVNEVAATDRPVVSLSDVQSPD